MLLLLPPYQDRLLGHLWMGAAQIELPVAISMKCKFYSSKCAVAKSCLFVADGML